MRYFLYLSYQGTNYHGWQKQPNAPSVQAVLEEKMAILLRENVEVVASGRTDAGVHAQKQVVHFDWPKKLVQDDFIYKLNKLLPHDIAVNKLLPVKEDAHARFDAVSRSYRYRLSRTKQVFMNDLYYHFVPELDIELMNKAALLLKRYQDFESFSRVKTDVYTFNCTISEAVWKTENDFLVFHVSANRFLRGMVRALVGTLLEVGQQRLSVADFEEVIKSKNRQKAGRAVPASGLFLSEINYPKELFI